MNKVRIGVAGAGNISDIYLRNITGVFSGKVAAAAIANRTREKAEKAAERWHIQRVLTLEELVNAEDVDLILNLTAPDQHYKLAMAAVKAGKHVYNEKPLCITREEAATLLKSAAENKARVGCAPDTFLGAGMQTCRKLLDDGWIGRPLAGAAFVLNHGMEAWHPSPEAFYKAGGGPLFDVGPYYLTALVNLLGPIARVSGSARKSFETRVVTSEPLAGTVIAVETPTHVAATLDFANNAVVTLAASFDVWSHSLPYIELYGTEGTLRLPDPNTFRGAALIRRFRAETWSEIPLVMHHVDDCKDADDWRGSANLRGLGVVDMAEAIANGSPHRASGEMAYHVLDVMHGIYEAAASGVYYTVKSSCERPEAFQGV
ncbi:MAG: Gfo/Idh/MocA family oxidoreductase [Treponema sp.]|jgi:predicted dehydrogenase|nr:Gfo/Idh/MocA family oxidoreductase [Treponema sp.]